MVIMIKTILYKWNEPKMVCEQIFGWTFFFYYYKTEVQTMLFFMFLEI